MSAVASRLQEGERLFAFLDDLYVLCDPTRVLDVHAILQQELSRHAGIQIHHGKTKVWNQGGVVPVGVECLEVEARRIDLDAIVWRGNSDIHGTPRFRPGSTLKVGRQTQCILMDRINFVDDLQSAWLLLVFCTAARANFFLRSDPLRNFYTCNSSR